VAAFYLCVCIRCDSILVGLRLAVPAFQLDWNWLWHHFIWTQLVLAAFGLDSNC